jgi:hypothetical protein
LALLLQQQSSFKFSMVLVAKVCSWPRALNYRICFVFVKKKFRSGFSW